MSDATTPASPTAPTPVGINAWIKKTAAGGPVATQSSGTPMMVDLDLLDTNPEQPRQAVDAEWIAELAASIRMQGQIQSITVSRQPSGRYFVIAGHCRTDAFRLLRDSATDDTERARWSRIAAMDRGPATVDQLGELALTENLLRENLRPMDTAQALAKLRDRHSLSTEDLAERLGMDLTKTKRYLQLAGAPLVLSQALAKGLMVEVGDSNDDKTDTGKPRREHRNLELHHALLLMRAHAFWTRTKPKKAADLIRALIERVLVEGWTHRRLKDHVDALCHEGKASETGDGGAPASTRPKTSQLYQNNDEKLVVNRTRLAEAAPEERASLRDLLQELITSLG